MGDDFPQRISLAEAEAIVDAAAAEHRPAAAALPLEGAHGCVLSRTLIAPLPLPPFDNSAMDGFALRGADLNTDQCQRLRLVGEQFAARAEGLRVAVGECIRITTGAPLPAGADTVVARERCREHDGWVEIDPGVAIGANIRQAGEDVRVGEAVLRAGQRLTASRIGLAAALGFAELPVRPRPRVAIFASGDELRPVGQALAPGEIHDSNGPMLSALLAEQGIVATRGATMPDLPARMYDLLRAAAREHTVLITCGGVSAGEKDHLPALLKDHGRLHFWRARIKPGMPVLLGELHGALVLGLPGNPVAVLACFMSLGRRLLNGLEGCVEPPAYLKARLLHVIDKRHPRLEFMRGRLSVDAEGGLRVAPDFATGSNRLAAAAGNNALIVVPEGARLLAVSTSVAVLPYGPIHHRDAGDEGDCSGGMG